MGLTLFKPTKNVKGFLLETKFNSKDQAVWLIFKKQTAWNDAKSLGSFKGGESVFFKLSMEETASIINCIEKEDSFSKYHAGYENNKSQIFFSSAFKTIFLNKETGKEIDPDLDDEVHPKNILEKRKLKGFSLRCVKINDDDKDVCSMNFNPEQSVLFREYLKFALSHCFSAIYAEDKKLAKDFAKSKESHNHSSNDENDDIPFD